MGSLWSKQQPEDSSSNPDILSTESCREGSCFDASMEPHGRLLLAPGDIILYDAPMWLNDKCINFWLEHVHYDLLKNNQDIVFMSPCALAVTIHLKPEMVADSVFLLKLPQRQLVFLPINDNTAASVGGGTHWSLLVYSRLENEFRYYDSSSGSKNISTAKACAKCMRLALNASAGPSFINDGAKTPQQTNMYDCGVYLALFTQTIATCYVETGKLPSLEELNEAVTPIAAAQLRADAKQLALSMSQPQPPANPT